MPQLDIALDHRLQELLEKPICVPLPQPGSLGVTLPTGGQIKGIGDFTKGIPTDCTLGFSLLVQLGPLLGNLECLVRVLKLIKPLIDIVKGLPFPPVKAIADFAEAAKGVGECIVSMTTPLGMIPFVRDLLCLIIKILKCLVAQFKSISSLMSGITLQLKQAEGNPELTAALQCAQDNAATSAAAATQALEPIVVILQLAGTFLEIAGAPTLTIPSFGGAADPEQIKEMVTVLEGFVNTLQLVADGLGGCN